MKALLSFLLLLILVVSITACLTINIPPAATTTTTTTTETPPKPPTDDSDTQTPPGTPIDTMVVYHGNHPKVKQAVLEANKILNDTAFYKNIRQLDDFAFTGESPRIIAKRIQDSGLTVRVRLYKETDTETTAYFSSDHPNTIFLNSAKLDYDRDMADIINTIVHETVHAVDRAHQNLRFGHGDNDSEGKDNSAPYWIGALAECMYEGSRNGCGDAVVSKLIAQYQNEFKLVESAEINEYDILD